MKRLFLIMCLGGLALPSAAYAQTVPVVNQAAPAPKKSVLYPPDFGISLTKEGWRVSLNQATFTANGSPVPYRPYPTPPSATFKTLADSALRQWIGQLPQWSSLLGEVTVSGRSRDPNASRIESEVWPQFSDLQLYCRIKKVRFFGIVSAF